MSSGSTSVGRDWSSAGGFRWQQANPWQCSQRSRQGRRARSYAGRWGLQPCATCSLASCGSKRHGSLFLHCPKQQWIKASAVRRNSKSCQGCGDIEGPDNDYNSFPKELPWLQHTPQTVFWQLRPLYWPSIKTDPTKPCETQWPHRNPKPWISSHKAPVLWDFPRSMLRWLFSNARVYFFVNMTVERRPKSILDYHWTAQNALL